MNSKLAGDKVPTAVLHPPPKVPSPKVGSPGSRALVAAKLTSLPVRFSCRFLLMMAGAVWAASHRRRRYALPDAILGDACVAHRAGPLVDGGSLKRKPIRGSIWAASFVGWTHSIWNFTIGTLGTRRLAQRSVWIGLVKWLFLMGICDWLNEIFYCRIYQTFQLEDVSLGGNPGPGEFL